MIKDTHITQLHKRETDLDHDSQLPSKRMGVLPSSGYRRIYEVGVVLT